MKNRLLLLVLMISVTLATQAQQGFQHRTVEERVKLTMQRVNDSLKLDANQQAQTDSAFTAFYKGMDKMREERQQGTRPDRSQMEKLMNDRDEQLKRIWTDDQFKRYKEMEAAMRSQRRMGMGQGNN